MRVECIHVSVSGPTKEQHQIGDRQGWAAAAAGARQRRARHRAGHPLHPHSLSSCSLFSVFNKPPRRWIPRDLDLSVPFKRTYEIHQSFPKQASYCRTVSCLIYQIAKPKGFWLKDWIELSKNPDDFLQKYSWWTTTTTKMKVSHLTPRCCEQH